jgi:hypothetical protein
MRSEPKEIRLIAQKIEDMYRGYIVHSKLWSNDEWTVTAYHTDGILSSNDWIFDNEPSSDDIERAIDDHLREMEEAKA